MIAKRINTPRLHGRAQLAEPCRRGLVVAQLQRDLATFMDILCQMTSDHTSSVSLLKADSNDSDTEATDVEEGDEAADVGDTEALKVTK